MLELVRIEVANYRPFYKENNIDIGYSKKKMDIFEADNGGGKTSLAEAVKWGLFGLSLENRESQEKSDFELFNKAALMESSLIEPVKCRVTLTFENNDINPTEKLVFSREMQVIRKSDFHKTQNGAIEIRLEEFEFIKLRPNFHVFTALRWLGSKQESSALGPEAMRDTYFPSMVNDYYVVFGENFVDPQNPQKIRFAIEQNCYVNVFDKIKNNLDTLKIDIIKKNASSDKKKEKLDNLIEQKVNVVAQITGKKKEIENKKDELTRFRDAISKIDKKIGESGSKQAAILKDERKNKEDEIKKYNRDISLAEREVGGDSFSIMIKMLSREAQKELSEELEKRIKKGEIPPRIKTEFLESLLEKKKCICERPITNKEYKILKEMLEENVIGKNYNKFLELKFKLKENLETLQTDVEEYKKKLARLEGLKTTKVSIQDRLNNISSQLDSLKGVDELESQRKIYGKRAEDLEGDIELLKQELSDLETVQKDTLADIEKLGSIDIKNKDDIALTKTIDNLILLLQKTKNSTVDATRKDVEKLTFETYKKSFKKVEDVKSVELDADYNVRAILKQNQKNVVKTNFSSGEKLVFAMSFLTALRRFSGYIGPIFLESPFSLLDEHNKAKVALNLSETIPGQLVIFTREDILADIKNDLKNQINKIIHLSKVKEWHSSISIKTV